MSSLKKLMICCLFVAFILVGCIPATNPTEKIEYYTLEYDPPTFTGLEPLPWVIQVRQFRAAPFYTSSRIIFQEGRFKRDAYIYHQWRVKPSDLVTFFLKRDIRSSSLFNAVFGPNSQSPPSHTVEGTVEEFFERDEENFWEAILSISIILMKEKEPDITRRVLLQKTYRANSPCAKRNPRALAEAMSDAMVKVSEQIIRDIHRSLSGRSLSGGARSAG